MFSGKPVALAAPLIGAVLLVGLLSSVAALPGVHSVPVRSDALAVAPRSVSAGPRPAATPSMSHMQSGIVEVSAPCDNGANAEVEQATDPVLGYVYEEWMAQACGGIAFARSTDGGLTFGAPMSVPGSVGSTFNSWDPALAVAPDGTLYAAFMRSTASQWFPVVAASFDHGKTFTQVSYLVPPEKKNWGDRDFIAVAPNGTVYVTWDYGPERTSVTFICSSSGSCAFATGDLNVVVQWSVDRGRAWSRIVPISPGFPASGGDSAPILVEPDGRLDVLYQGYTITNTTTYTMTPAYSYFTSSSDGGATWSAPVRVGPTGYTMSLSEWWIDGSLGMDVAGNLYATWDTQGATDDIGWLSYSTDHGATWSPLVRVTPDPGLSAHIVEVTGGGPGTAYVGWLANNSTGGWAMYVRAFSISGGLLTPPIQVSELFGAPPVWPGDTVGISTLSPTVLAVSWGSGVPVRGQPKSQIFETTLTFTLG